jgi:hypothetical protein
MNNNRIGQNAQQIPLAALFALTLLLSSGLLFLVQPMVAKMLLPSLGSSPGVWNTCMVFFQAGLLAGYAYAHVLPRWLGPRRHAVVHLLVLGLPFLVLPIAFSDTDPPVGVYPAVWLLWVLLVSVGLPYIVVASCGPLLQRWFARTGHPAAGDPYFLYAASNLGSMLALVLYPVVVEPNLALVTQGRLWTAGFALLAVMLVACSLFLWRAQPAPAQTARDARSIAWTRRLRWLALAAAPSSLMLSVTTYLTADIASIPLLWVVPIGLYLLSFTLVFARQVLLPHPFMVRWMPLLVVVLVLALLSEATEPAGLLIMLHLLGLFWICMVCHGELARTRPGAEVLTEFYLWLAVGGVGGGLFNTLVAPVVFSTVLEYPLVLVLACLLRPAAPAHVPALSSAAGWRRRRLDLLLPLMVGLITLALVVAGQSLDLPPGGLSVAFMFALPAVVCYTFLERPVRFGLGIGALLLASTFYRGVHGRAEYQVRSFFGVHRVTRDAAGRYRYLIHGNTVHGQQSLDPQQRDQPLTYYHRKGPIGQFFEVFDGDPRLRRVAIVGLGAGSLAAYAQPGDHWTFFEIDPVVVQIAEDRGKFTYLQDARRRLGDSGQIDVVVGDARLTLQKSRETFGLIIIDAFSSDAIPLHLLTREALRIYQSRLSADGILALNISNRFLDLTAAVASLAQDARPPMTCLVREDLVPRDLQPGQSLSIWGVLVGSRANAEKLTAARQRWEIMVQPPGTPVWTDDFSNVLEMIRWGGGR